MAVHQAPSEVMLCAQEPRATGLTTQLWLQLLLKCGHVDTVKQTQWNPHRRILLHETWVVTTVIGLAVSLCKPQMGVAKVLLKLISEIVVRS